MPDLTRPYEGKRGVPNQVNDGVALWGLILQYFHAHKKCRSSSYLLGGEKKKNLALAVQKLKQFFWDT